MWQCGSQSTADGGKNDPCPLSYKRLGPAALEQIEFADAQAGQQMASQTLECPTLTTINHY